MEVGDKVKPSKNCRPLYGDPEVMTITDRNYAQYKVNLHSTWFNENELELIEDKDTLQQPYYSGEGNHSVKELESLCRQFTEYIHQLNVKETYTREELKQYAFFAVQYSVKLEIKNPNKLIHKSQIDNYLDSELD